MSAELKNNTKAVEEHESAIGTQADAISDAGSTEGILTNLTVVDNLQCVIEHINASVNDYKTLSYEDVDAILAVHERHNNTDQEQTEEMSK